MSAAFLRENSPVVRYAREYLVSLAILSILKGHLVLEFTRKCFSKVGRLSFGNLLLIAHLAIGIRRDEMELLYCRILFKVLIELLIVVLRYRLVSALYVFSSCLYESWLIILVDLDHIVSEGN